MKQKTDETPDEWVRHMLRDLPDAPPPGSSFDSARLWGQLRPDIQARPARRRAGWWLAAACITALLTSWLVWKPGSEPKPAATYQPPAIRSDTSLLRPENATFGPAVAGKTQAKLPAATPVHRRLPPVPDNPVYVPKAIDSEMVAQRTDTLFSTNQTAVVDKLTEQRKPNVAVKTPQRRFQVMHENELRAEDEAAPIMYRTDHFVRLGKGQPVDKPRADNVPEPQLPALVMPLKTQSNQ